MLHIICKKKVDVYFILKDVQKEGIYKQWLIKTEQAVGCC